MTSNLLILAVLIRLLIMPFYFHPDIKTYHFQSSFLKQGVFDIYSYLEKNKEKLPLKEEFVYFPLTYFFLGGYQILISPILGPNFTNWLSDASVKSVETVGIYRYLFLLKLPYLFLDILIGFLLTLFFTNRQQKRKAFIFWLFNPFSIILIYIYSNVDIIPVVLLVLSLYLANRKKFITSSFVLGIAAGFKAFPLLLLPFLIMFGRTLREKLLILFTALAAFTLIIFPFLGQDAFQKSTLISSLTTRIVSSGLNIEFGEMLLPAIIALSALFFYAFMTKKGEVYKYWLFSFLLIFSSIHFHIQWLLWVAPLLVILFIEKPQFVKPMLILILLIFSIPLLYQDSYMTVGLFNAISPLFSSLPTPAAILQRVYDPYTFSSILHSMLLGGSLIFGWRLLNSK